MARARILHPNFFSDSDLLSLTPIHRLLFAGLWGLADKHGVLEDKPIEIKMRVLPVDNCDVQQLLADLDRVGRIIRYQVGDRRLILVKNFLRYQKPHPKESDSALPEPPRPRKHSKPSSPARSTLIPPKSGGDDPVTDPVSDPVSGDDPVTVEKLSAARPSPPVLKLVGDAAPPARKRSDGQAFRDWAESERRQELGLVTGAEPDAAALNTWFARAVAEVGIERLRRGWARYLLKPVDGYWRERGFPFQGFMSDSGWRQYVPPEERAHVR